ncbi:MAG: ABC transporter ATP-binding protein [Verrucomicrobiales bacterium]|nr:ABC transporter ATP-binding protein [Verrucomicrobiales bacterium]|tara:strand:- start:11468 stop:13312 length:1845 start_codon:yes stop_codon:yes gene_type:complete
MAQHNHADHTATGGDPTFKARKRSTGEVIRRVWVYVRPYYGLAATTIGCAVLSLIFALTYPKLTQIIIDEIIKKNTGDTELLGWAVLGLAGAFFLRDLFNSLRIRVNNHFEQNVIYDMRRDVFAKLQRHPVSYFDKRASGDLMTRVVEDINNVERVLIDGTEQGTVAVLCIGGITVILFLTNPFLALIALAPLPFLAIGALWYTLTAHRRYRRQREAASAMNALLMDDLQGIRQIKAFGRQDHEDARFADRAEDLRQGTLGIMRAWANYNPIMSFLAALGTVGVLWFGGKAVMAGEMTTGQLVGFLFYLMLFYEPVARLHGLNQMLQSARAAGERVFDILDHQPENTTDRPHHLKEPARGEVIYKNIEFEYEPDRPILKDIHLHAAPGEMIALVGPTGAGKSTLVNLLPAFYEPTAGRITIDGQDAATLSLDTLRRHIAIVSQEPFLFNGTIRENIQYGNLDATAADITAAARAANCHDFITALPEGYESRVGERGVKLSVGEKQRVSVARALLADAPLLILDEATASVDTATERLIQEALERLMRGRTTFVIAHRLSTIRNADQILVLKNGQITEQGTHDQLLKAKGLYAQLAQIQNTTFIEERFEKLETAEP